MPEEREANSGDGCGCGCFGGMFSVGGVIAFILSWKLFHSIGWALLAAFFGWVYVVYWLIYYHDHLRVWLG